MRDLGSGGGRDWGAGNNNGITIAPRSVRWQRLEGVHQEVGYEEQERNFNGDEGWEPMGER